MDIKDIKTLLWRWGDTLEYCAKKQSEISGLRRLINDIATESPPPPNGMPKASGISNSVENAVIKIIDKYEAAITELSQDIEKAMSAKKKIDDAILLLEPNERKIIRLRYAKGYGWESIPLQMHYSRRQCFFLHDKALEKIALFCTKFDL